MISIDLFLANEIVTKQSVLLGGESQKFKAVLISAAVANHSTHFPWSRRSCN